MFADLFVLLYVAHLVADYPGQTDHQAEHKAARGAAGWRANLAHAGTHLAVTAVVLVVVGVGVLGLDLSPVAAVLALLWISVTHAVIDRRWAVRWWMENTGQTQFLASGGAAHVDQTAHVVCLMVGALICA
ncbi:hypothetical protein ADL27_56935 [Streptomyces sp. NRRL F-6602]|nr:hypothetical protein ADL27_56935 [Streptomyces sp. NRRL F-6602]